MYTLTLWFSFGYMPSSGIVGSDGRFIYLFTDLFLMVDLFLGF